MTVNELAVGWLITSSGGTSKETRVAQHLLQFLARRWLCRDGAGKVYLAIDITKLQSDVGWADNSLGDRLPLIAHRLEVEWRSSDSRGHSSLFPNSLCVMNGASHRAYLEISTVALWLMNRLGSRLVKALNTGNAVTTEEIPDGWTQPVWATDLPHLVGVDLQQKQNAHAEAILDLLRPTILPG